MGMYSYICAHCGKAINVYQPVVLTHVRHGKAINRTKGHYDGYGGVEEDNKFDRWEAEADGFPSNHDEVTKSCFDFPDSVFAEDKMKPLRIYKGKPISLMDYAFLDEIYDTHDHNGYAKENGREKIWLYLGTLQDEYNALPANTEYHHESKSGVAAFHKKCFCEMERNGMTDELLVPSADDPNQGCGSL